MAVGSSAKLGIDSYVAVGKQASIATYASATTAIEPISCSFKTEVESEKLDQIGFNRGFVKRVTLGKMVGGTLETFLHPQESVLLIANAMGGPLVSSSISGGFAHSISAGNFNTTTAINFLSFNVRKGDTDTFRYVGGRVNSMKLSGAVGEPIKASFEIVFADSTQQSDDIQSSLSITAVVPFTFADAVFRYNATEGSLTSSVNEPIQSFELTINNNLVTDSAARSLGTITVDVLPATRREIEFKVTNRYDTTTTYQRFISATQGSVELLFQGQAISGTALPFYEMRVRMPKVYNAAGDVEIGGADEVLVAEVPYDVLVDSPLTTTGKDIGITIQNSTASY